MTLLPVAPLAQGDGFAELLGVLSSKGKAVFVDPPVFDPHLVWQTVEQEEVVALTINGDALRPAVARCAPSRSSAEPAPTSLRTIRSSDAPLSRDVAVALETALPGRDDRRPDRGAGAAREGRGAHDRSVRRRSAGCASIRASRTVSSSAISDPRVGKVVVAIVEVTEQHHLDAPELAAWCRAHVPATMTPGRFVFVDRIERSPSGAADEQALRVLAIDRLTNDR